MVAGNAMQCNRDQEFPSVERDGGLDAKLVSDVTMDDAGGGRSDRAQHDVNEQPGQANGPRCGSDNR